MFGFRNPGLMRVPPEIAIKGGEHDCRNRILHKMFRLVGIGEQAGSGIPKIYDGWASQHWRAPALYERTEPYNQTLIELRMVDLLPSIVIKQLQNMFGSQFETLGRNERLALAAVASEVTVTHGRIRELTGLPSIEASRLLQSLVRGSFMESHNSGRGAVYCLPGASIPIPEEVFISAPSAMIKSSPNLESNPVKSASSSPNLESIPVESASSSPNLESNPAESASSSPNLELNPAESASSSPNLVEIRDADGCLLTNLLRLPVVDDLSLLSPSLLASLETIAEEPRNKGKVDRVVLINVIESLCDGRYITLRCLADLVNRKPDTLRDQYLSQLVRDRKLSMAFPTTPTHERQAYSATPS